MSARMVELCAGIGAMSYVWRDVLGQEIAGQVEIDPFCLRVLEAHFPGVPRRTNIREVKGTEFGSVDLVCAGFPCQPASFAGKRRGARDDRWLWPDVYRIIRAVQPAWVLLENVPGLLSMGLDTVLDELGAAGYEAWPVVLPAAAVGAPHLRDRVFIVGHRIDDATVAHRDGDGGGRAQRANAGSVGSAARADTEREGHLQRDAAECGSADGGERVAQAQPGMGRSVDGLSAWLDEHRCQWPAGPGEAQHEWEAPRTVTGSVPDRVARLKALGNAIVPQQVAPILAAILHTHLTYGQEAA